MMLAEVGVEYCEHHNIGRDFRLVHMLHRLVSILAETVGEQILTGVYF